MSDKDSKPFTIEAGLYVAILTLALVVRVYRLGLAPLATGEAQLALAAFRGTLPPGGASPVLYSLDSILFAILGSGDGLARLVPALVGAVLVVTPAFWRERIGRAGALGAAAVLAISPVAIMASRTSSGEVIAAAIMVGLVAAADRYLQTGRTAWLYAGAAMLGVGLASGQSIYSALLILLIAGLAIVSGHANEARLKWQAIRNTPGLWGPLVGVLVAVFVASATALMWQPGGMGKAADLLSTWLAGFRMQAGDTAWYWPLQLLAVYEPLAVVSGVVGLFWALGRADGFVRLLVTWLIVALLSVLLHSGRTTGEVLLVVIPLALLSGYVLEALAGSLHSTHLSVEEGVLIAVILPVIAYFMLGLAGYANNPDVGLFPGRTVGLGPVVPFIPMFLAIVLLVIMCMLFAALTNAEIAVRGGTVAVLVMLGMATWSAGWGAAQAHPGDPRELIAGPEATSPAVRNLVHDLAVLSAQTTTDPTTLAIVVQSSPDGVLGWYLRDMPNARFAPALDTSSDPGVIVTTDLKPPALSGSYAGQRFTVQQEWRIEGRPVNDVIKWLVYRVGEAPKPTQQAVLWVRQGP